ncbi:MAG: hypothetical protein K2X87_34580 [Gemmataceae bacterium]|nr:hypothetical protein [Gemmataceae bacterium]
MTADALLAETFRRSDQLLLAWAVHSAVAVAVLGLVLGVPAIRADRSARRALAGVFAFLAVANLEAMLWVLKQWRAVFAALDDSAGWALFPGRLDLAEVAAAPPAVWVVPFHLALDAAVVWVALRPGRAYHHRAGPPPAPSPSGAASHADPP